MTIPPGLYEQLITQALKKELGSNRPGHLEQLFISVQTLNARQLWEQVPPDFFDYIVVDECHHGAAFE